MAHEHVVAGIAAALGAGALTADAIALEARKAAEADDPHTAEDQTEEPEPSPVSAYSSACSVRYG
ncbi:hypothetical protein SAMN04487981_118151 [Streptomyces sp. cf386]|uniref:hypothetical protein n=1 Tax=Streptomyces sp. cf386 TaxID=1761904 RepID=UPI000891F541|nr:hypothetical protein [Streptomyces sp. cf386]SDP23454.1 hypothetical protein SAMN04487981_118151 [Streptomyces sp. cf386]